jgi:hypothetical protein
MTLGLRDTGRARDELGLATCVVVSNPRALGLWGRRAASSSPSTRQRRVEQPSYWTRREIVARDGTSRASLKHTKVVWVDVRVVVVLVRSLVCALGRSQRTTAGRTFCQATDLEPVGGRISYNDGIAMATVRLGVIG